MKRRRAADAATAGRDSDPTAALLASYAARPLLQLQQARGARRAAVPQNDPAADPDQPTPPPPNAEFKKVSGITALGFIAAGFIGFFIKLIFIVSPHARMRPCSIQAM